MSPRPPPKISFPHDWTRGNDELGSTVDQQPEGKVVTTVTRRSFSTCNILPTNPNQNPNQSVIDQGNLIARKMCLLFKGETSRSHEIDEKVFTKNSVLQIDQGNLVSRLAWLKLTICLKNIPKLSKTHDRSGQPDRAQQLKQTTRCSWSTSWNCVTQHGQWIKSWNHRGGHRLQHSKTTTFYREAIA